MRSIHALVLILCALLTLAIGLAGGLALTSLQGARADEPAKPGASTPPEFPVEAVAYFEQKVRPLLESRCFECHGPAAKKLQGGLRLDSRASVLKGGDSGPAIVPGKPGESVLIDAIHYRSFEMPPRSKLPDGEIAILTRWVELGAPWSKGGDAPIVREQPFPLEQRKRDHWAWQPIRPVAPPPPAAQRASWPRSDIDRFILAKLVEKGLEPAPDADRHTLIRRASFALIGLPPTPAEVEDFVNDPAPTQQAFEKVVDRLLDSPHFGERWGRHWLDLVRYAETLGHEFDYPLHHAYQYRDYVIRAFNADVSYDQLVREHIAGDLLANPRLHPAEGYNESLIGTGFWYLGEDKHAPVDVRGEEAALIDNRIDVFSKTFLGLTVACARCHDHKFDAISARDYYALFGFLKSSRRQVGLLDPHGTIAAAAADLQRLQAVGSKAIAESLPKPGEETAAEFARYLKASREAMYGEPKPGDAASVEEPASPDIVFEDFERETWGDQWTAEGAAFAKGPTAGTLPNQQAVSGFEGKRLVNSYVGGDNTTGRLTSKPFVIKRKSIRFLIGGGSFAGSTCLNLVVAGKVVRTAAGKNNEKLEPAAWDVTEFAGKAAELQIVDQQKGGWGHVNVDHIVFTDGDAGISVRRPIAVVAKEFNVDAALLRRWVQALGDPAVKQPTHPMSTWAAVATVSNDEFHPTRRKWLDRLAAEADRSETSSTAAPLFENFDRGDYDGWFVTGNAFGARPTDARDWNSQSAAGLMPGGVAHSGALSNRLCGVLRSKSFILKHPQILYRVAGKDAKIRLIIDGYQMDVFNGLLFGGVSFNVNNEQFAWHTQTGDVSRYQGHRCYIELIDDGDGWLAVDEIRFANSGGPPTAAPDSYAFLAAGVEGLWTHDTFTDYYGGLWSAALGTWLTPERDALTTRLVPWALERGLLPRSKLEAALSPIASEVDARSRTIPAPMRIVAITDGNGEDERVFIRGSHKNLGGAVPRRMLEAIAGNEQPTITNGSGRLELAERLLGPSNPFPARVMANRIWHHLFGRGIVASVDNLGVLGERPTHPELLDWLAAEFRSSWSIKRLIRTIVLSRAWQMASNISPATEEVDPQNLFLHRQNIRRLEGEAIRDSMLAISGRLDRTVYGPSVPVHLTPFMQGRGRPGGGPLDGNGRRSVYTSVNRNFLPPMMLAFDTPIPFTTIGRRNVSNVPAQALILMNDPFVVEQTRLWARRTVASGDSSPESRIDRLYRDAFSRSPTEAERAEAIAFLNSQATEYGLAESAWNNDERPWSDLCHVLANVKEFIFVN